MKITCQSCQSKYTVSDEKVQGKTVKIKCRKCGATILVNSGGVTTSGAGVADPLSIVTGGGADGAATYLVNVADGDQRSMTLAEVVAAYNTSVITADTYVWSDGMNDWSPISQVDAIVAALNAPAAAPSSPSTSPPAAASAPPPAAAPMAAAAVAAEPEHRAAARRDPARRAAQDLFSARGPEEAAVATSAPTYANGSSNGAPAPAPRAAAPLPGQREENSMLFSLSALTAKVGTSASPSSAPSALAAPRVTTAKDRDDSGIIDLKALAAAAAATQSSAQPSTSSFLPDTGLFPLGAPMTSSPIAAPPVVSSSEVPQTKNKTPIFIGVGAVVAVGAIVGAFLFMRGGPLPPPPVAAVAGDAVSAEPTAPPPAETASAAPSDSAVASAAPSTSASASAAVVAAKGGRGGGAPRGGGAAPPRGGGANQSGGGSSPPPPPAKKSGGCGCAAGDLMCAMKCSAKK